MREPDRIDTDTKARTIDYVWSLPDRPWEGESAPSHTEVHLHVAHSTYQRGYSAMLTRRGVIATPEGYTVHVSNIAPGEGVTVLVEPTARYSAKGLERTASKALAVLEASQDDERVIALMAGSSTRAHH